MSVQKVKEVSKVFDESGNERAAKHKKSRWSIRFLQFLMEDFEKEEEEKEKRDTAAKGESRLQPGCDTLEISEEDGEQVLGCELYADVSDNVRRVGNWRANVLYKIANAIMYDYYGEALDERGVWELFWACYEKCIEKNEVIAESDGRKHEILRLLYEYFARANAKKSVAENEKEGRGFVEVSSLTWTGTTYYNAKYFYRWENMHRLLRRVCNEISVEQKIPVVPFAEMERRTQFFCVGGLTFHGVFVWAQQKDNYPSSQYGMKELEKAPPKTFVYLYRNHYDPNETERVVELGKKIKRKFAGEGKALWRSFLVGGGRDYNNGMSYLLEGSLIDEQDEQVYCAAMSFLQNFRLYRLSGCVEYLFTKA